MFGHLKDLYNSNPNVPIGRRPNLIHMAVKYVYLCCPNAVVITPGTSETTQPTANDYPSQEHNPDLIGVVWTLDPLQCRAAESSHVVFDYAWVLNSVLAASTPHPLSPNPILPASKTRKAARSRNAAVSWRQSPRRPIQPVQDKTRPTTPQHRAGECCPLSPPPLNRHPTWSCKRDRR